MSVDAAPEILGSYQGVRTLVHELGHLLNLYHSWGADACPDTPTHPNCWAYDASDPDCDQWGVEISNNIIDYNQWQGWSLSPCQLDRVHNELDGPLYDHVVQCSECKPASVFFDMEPSQCAPVRLDGTASDNEDRFFVEIYEVANVGDTAPIANLSSSRWYPGQVGVIDDLGAFAGFHFGAGRTYLVKVAVQSDAPGGSNGSCVTWDEQVSYVRIPPSIACPMDTIDIKGSRE
jgi:hypothetical protein